jgi:hypothetical protein
MSSLWNTVLKLKTQIKHFAVRYLLFIEKHDLTYIYFQGPGASFKSFRIPK